MFHRVLRVIEWMFFAIIWASLMGGSNPLFANAGDRVRAHTRAIEFDYVDWSLDAMLIKLEQGAAGLPHSLTREQRKQIVFEYMRVTYRVFQTQAQIEIIYSDPNIQDKQTQSAYQREYLAGLLDRQAQLAPLAESILQEQIAQAAADLDVTSGGQPIPPVLYHVSAVPMALIISPRDRIEQSANISLIADITLEDQIKLEDQVAQSHDVSTLVVPIGGVGVYPTMVMQTTDLRWTLETIAHEWTHNYLTLHPLGMLYDATPELRTMNETTASIAGTEIGTLVMETHYPELLASDSSPNLILFNDRFLPSNRLDDPPPFDFRKEMHETRVTADQLLAEGKIEEAESYMEQRRQIFLQNGYLIRKLNQAYFAFHGAYADVPGGAAGEDPVGPAVRALREQSASLADFLRQIAWMTSFDQLKQVTR